MGLKKCAHHFDPVTPTSTSDVLTTSWNLVKVGQHAQDQVDGSRNQFQSASVDARSFGEAEMSVNRIRPC